VNQELCPDLCVDGRCFDRFHVIRHSDPHAGFSSLLTIALNGIRKALENNWLPVVNYNNEVNAHFYDPDHGPNVWEYYFEPVMGISYARIEELLTEGEISESDLHAYPADLIWEWHRFDPDRIATFWHDEAPEDPRAWMSEKRRLGREYVSRYLHVKPHIRRQVEHFYEKHIAPQYTFGVHIRGTDLAYAEPTEPSAYFRAIDDLARQKKIESFRVFLATDQSQFVDRFSQQFGDRLITYSSTRSTSDVPVFLFQDMNPYKKGEDVLMDIMLLAKCDFLLKGASAVGEYALWFNPDLDCVDFALESHYDSTHSVPAFLKLNVGQMGAVKRRLWISYFRGRRWLLLFGMRLGRMLLPRSLRDWLWRQFGRRLFFTTIGCEEESWSEVFRDSREQSGGDGISQ